MAAVVPVRPSCDSNPATPGAQSLKEDAIEEESNDGSQPPKRRRMGSGDSSRSCDTSSQELGPTYFPAENLTEYKWPPDDTGEYYMLQEQVSEYLGVTSFKRKYPDMERRDLSHKEKLYLREQNVITETQCTLGLTALRSDEVIDLMIKEYPTKHSEYSVILQERERQRIAKEYSIIQVPQGRFKVLAPELTRTGPYPVALIPGQFQDYYKRYSPNELRYLPLNTALFEPPLDPELPGLDSEPDSDDAEDGKDDKKNKNSSDSSSGNTSDVDSQEGGPGHKSKAKDRTSMPGKDGSQRHSASHKATPGYKPKVIPNAICGICQKGKEANKKGKPEALIHCSQCDNSGHPSCLDMSEELVRVIQTYRWQCMECKTCTVCQQPHHEDEMMFCDKCDRGYHTFCIGMETIPNGLWVCEVCDKDFTTFKKKGGNKTPKKSKSAQK
ncbi:PHD finger protein 10 isoform X2 [Mastacembelus armatus]|uniref:PHD finger protein 10 isoform X2 n=1 Tax=Mastacembelus armatus TaxID=205130 RepID=UPI000E4594BC|nr:PHD finger protein 10 isoform X2 [Mastacembelus armatus]